MHAVVVKVAIRDFDPARQFLTEQVVPRVKEAPGFVTGYWTRGDDDSGLSMIVFESQENARNVAEMIESQGMDEAVDLQGVEVREVVANA